MRNLRWLIPISLAISAYSVEWAYAQSSTTVGPPGAYSFSFTSNAPTRITSGPNWIKIEWTGDATPPPPTPVPPEPGGGGNPVPPNPTPPKPTGKPIAMPGSPVKGPLFLVASWDGDTLSPLQKSMIGDKSFGKTLGTGSYWKAYAVSDPILNGWRTDAVAAGNPSLLVIGEGGKLLTSGALPPGPQDVRDLEKKLRGG